MKVNDDYNTSIDLDISTCLIYDVGRYRPEYDNQ